MKRNGENQQNQQPIPSHQHSPVAGGSVSQQQTPSHQHMAATEASIPQQPALTHSHPTMTGACLPQQLTLSHQHPPTTGASIPLQQTYAHQHPPMTQVSVPQQQTHSHQHPSATQASMPQRQTHSHQHPTLAKVGVAQQHTMPHRHPPVAKAGVAQQQTLFHHHLPVTKFSVPQQQILPHKQPVVGKISASKQQILPPIQRMDFQMHGHGLKLEHTSAKSSRSEHRTANVTKTFLVRPSGFVKPAIHGAKPVSTHSPLVCNCSQCNTRKHQQPYLLYMGNRPVVPNQNVVRTTVQPPAHHAPPEQNVDKITKRSAESEEDSQIFFRGNVLNKKYRIVCPLKRGAFGKVMECVDLSKDNTRVAIKAIKCTDKKSRDFAMREINMLRFINFLDSEKKFAYVHMLDWFKYQSYMCIVFELYGQNTHDFQELNGFRPFVVDQIRHMAYQIFTAMHFLHENNIVHTNLKPEEILFVVNDMKYDQKLKQFMRSLRGLDVKVTDFGNAVYICQYHTGLVTTQPYRAPEVVLDLEWNAACDVWSLGCVLLEYYLGHKLFKAFDNVEHLAMMEKVLGPIPVHMLRKTRKKNYIHQDRLAWDENTLRGLYVKENFRRLQDYMRSRESDHEQLFDLLRKMLEFDIAKRITMGLHLPYCRESPNGSLFRPFSDPMPPEFLKAPSEAL